MNTDVLVEVSPDGVALVTLNRPATLNAFTASMAVDYLNALRDLDADPRVRVIVITGAGRGFCSGADLGLLAELAAGTASVELPDGLSYDLPLRLGVPVVAAVNGAAAGIGTATLLSADVRFLAASAKVSATFARLGLVAEYGTAWLLPRLIGHGAAMEILLSGRTLDAQECLTLGLAQRVVPDDDLLPEALEWAREVATRCAPRAVSIIKTQVLEGWELGRERSFDDSVTLMEASFTSPEVAEGVAAMLAKRAAVFVDVDRSAS